MTVFTVSTEFVNCVLLKFALIKQFKFKFFSMYFFLLKQTYFFFLNASHQSLNVLNNFS